METPQGEKTSETSKKCPYDDITREELVQKCKHLLMIAQKSRQSKKEISEENAQLKTQLEVTSKDVSTLQEIVESLTEQKLNFVTESETHSKLNDSLKSEIVLLKEEHKETVQSLTIINQQLERRLNESNSTISNLEIESTSLRRQNKRLSDENECLLKQLEDLETQAERRNDVAISDITATEPQPMREKQTEKSATDIIDSSVDVHTLRGELTKATTKIEELTNALNANSADLAILRNELEEKTKLHKVERDTKEKLHLRLKSYREKIVRCASSISQLKNSNLILSKTVHEYSKSVPKWQNNILKASNMLSDQLLSLESENSKLKKELQNATELNTNEPSDARKEFVELNLRHENLQTELQVCKDDKHTLEQQLKYLESSNEAFLNKVKQLESEKISREKDEKHLKDTVESLKESIMLKEHEMIRITEDSYEYKRIIDRLENEKVSLGRELEAFKANKFSEEIVFNLQKDLTKARDSYKVLEHEYKSLTDTNELLRDEVAMLKMSHESPSQEVGSLSELNASLQADVSKLETKLSAYKQENSTLLLDVKDLGQKLASVEVILKEAEEDKLRYSKYKIENAELLNEMKEVNQVLKERGETISKQEKAISESERVLQLLENEVQDLKQSLADLEKVNSDTSEELDSCKKSLEESKREKDYANNQIRLLRSEKESVEMALEEKDDLIALLRDDLEKLKHNSSLNDVQSEVMSTSTISKLDESTRLRELDDSFEERYNKLKSFAVKLKKKVDTLQASLQKSEEDRSALERDMADMKKQRVQADSKVSELTLASEQTNDNMNKTDSCKGHEKQVETLRSDNNSMIEMVSKLQEDLRRLVNEKVELEMALGELEKSKRDAESVKSKNGELDQLKADLEARSAELSSAKEQLEKARRDAKKKSVLSLEMADYERSMKEQGIKLEEARRKIAQMESTIDTQQATIVSLKTQVKLLEDQIRIEENQTREFKENLHSSSTTLEERDGTIAQKSEQISALERHIEDLKSANEELSIQLATSLGEKEKAVIALSNEKTELLHKLKKSEVRFAELEDKCQLKSNEYDSLITEFNTYKMRAQSVLRQNQVKDYSQEETLQNENVALTSEVESLKVKLESVKEECLNLSSNLSLEKRRAAESGTALSKLRQLSEQLTTELQATRTELQEERARSNVQVLTLTQCYKKQIADLEERIQTETAVLKKELSSLESHSTVKVGSGGHMAGNSDNGSDSSDAEINVAMLQREEGEGSESSPPPFLTSVDATTLSGSSVETNAKSSRRSPLPLERLLQEGVPDDLIGGENEMRFIEMSAEQQLAETKKRLDVQEQRVQHVSLLLSETERESARLGEMCTVLKAEVRRLTRALDRHTHAHNPEYLKNVLFKFLTLSAGDERIRLVPVLNTILTLSPEETHALDAVAKGVDTNSNRGWGSYLPWPGPR